MTNSKRLHLALLVGFLCGVPLLLFVWSHFGRVQTGAIDEKPVGSVAGEHSADRDSGLADVVDFDPGQRHAQDSGAPAGEFPSENDPQSVVGSRIVILYPDGSAAQGLPVYKAEKSQSRQALSGASELIGTTDKNGQLPFSDLPEDVGAMAIAYGRLSAAIVYRAALQHTPSTVIPRAVAQRFTLTSKAVSPPPNSEAFRLMLLSSPAQRFASPWFGSESPPAAVFSSHHLSVAEDGPIELYSAGSLEFTEFNERLTAEIAPEVHLARLTSGPFGWWVDEIRFDPSSERSIEFQAYELPIHELVTRNSAGELMPAPEQVRLSLKQLVDGKWRHLAQARVPSRNLSDGATAQFIIPPVYANSAAAVVAVWDEERQLEGEVYSSVPSRVFIQGDP